MLQFQKFTKIYGSGEPGRKKGIGGHHYDVTKWTRQERRAAAFDKKDPLSNEMIEAFKNGAKLAHG